MEFLRRISLEDVLKALREIVKDEVLKEKIEGLYIFGSLATKGFSYHDIDIAIKVKGESVERKIDVLSRVLLNLARKLKVNEDVINIVDIDSAPLALKFEIARKHIVVYGKELKELIRKASYQLPELQLELDRWANYNINSKPSKIIIESRISEIKRNIEYLRNNIVGRKLNEILKDYEKILAWERALHRLIEAMLDICRHLVSVYGLGIVESYGEYPQRLAQHGIMPRELAQKVRKLIGLRNIIVHQYAKINYEVMYKLTEIAVNEIAPKFLNWIEELIRHSK